MIDYTDETVTIFDSAKDQEVTEKIVKWEVWFVTGEGTFRDYAAGKATAKGESMTPVPVAICENIFEIAVKL